MLSNHILNHTYAVLLYFTADIVFMPCGRALVPFFQRDFPCFRIALAEGLFATHLSEGLSTYLAALPPNVPSPSLISLHLPHHCSFLIDLSKLLYNFGDACPDLCSISLFSLSLLRQNFRFTGLSLNKTSLEVTFLTGSCSDFRSLSLLLAALCS